MRLGTIIAAVLSVAALPAQAQIIAPAASAYARAIAAGYKASFLCSAIFNGGRDEAKIEAWELSGVYPEYNAILPTLKGTVDRERGHAIVPFSETLPPRRAEYRKGRGCIIMPIGATPPAPTAPHETPAPIPPDLRAWPAGDTIGTVRTPGPLIAQLAKGFDGATFGQGTRTSAIIVVRDGRIVAERYAEGFGPDVSQRTWSVAKSITGTLIGIAVGEGLVKVNEPARIPAWQYQPGYDPRRRITIDNLLRMASGLHTMTAGNRSDAVYFGGASVEDEPVSGLLEAMPGTRFYYSNDDIMLAMLSLRATIGEERYRDYPARMLFNRIGMRHTVFETDWRGNYVASSAAWTTARDLARLGMLWLNDGMWGGERILPAAWMRYATTPGGPQPSQGPNYGATFWLLNKTAGLPPGSFAAIGNRGQYVIIIPSHRTVIVRRGEDPYGTNFDGGRFAADILAALK